MNRRHGLCVAVLVSLWFCSSTVLNAAAPTGKVLLYTATTSPAADNVPVDWNRVVSALDRRLNAGFQSPRAQIRRMGEDRVEVTVLSDDPKTIKEIDRLATTPGSLEFRILANLRDHRALIDRAQQETGDIVQDHGKTLAWWVPVACVEEAQSWRSVEIPTRPDKHGGKEALQALVVKDPFYVTGADLLRVTPSMDSRGRPCIDFALTAKGGENFRRLTSENLPDPKTSFARKLAIIMDGKVHSAPSLQSVIGDRAEITGNFTKQQTEEIATVLNAGCLGVRLTRVDH